MFEAGALAKGLSTARVCTLLIDLEPKDIEDPLAQFNHTFPKKENMIELVRTLNNSLGSNGLDPRVLDQVFDTYWPQFEEGFTSIIESTQPQDKTQSKPRPQGDMLAEILENTRTLSQKMRGLEREVEVMKERERARLPLPLLKSKVADMVKHGISPEQIMDYFSGEVPRTVVRRLIHENMRSTTSNLDLDEL
ncbi:hypothetical protein [Neisseria sp.]|uniref:hypothetical protein n=1 Tax=Neisseria sp. TaxID=192066 RepID=UPI0026DB50A9|nr:hypothetical protein [Neisseria sp.]